MSNFNAFKKLARTASFILPSGIEAEIKEPMGSHQSLITKSDSNKKKKGIMKFKERI